MNGLGLALGAVGALAVGASLKVRGSRAQIEADSGVSDSELARRWKKAWHGSPHAAQIRASGVVRASAIPQAYRTVRSLAEALEAIVGSTNEAKTRRAMLLRDPQGGGLTPMQGRAYVSRKVGRAKDYVKQGGLVEVRPDPARMIPDEDWMIFVIGDILGIFHYDEIPLVPAMQATGDVRSVIDRVRAAIPRERWERLEADVLRALQAATPEKRITTSAIFSFAFSSAHTILYEEGGRRRIENVLFVVLATASREMLRELSATPKGRAALRAALYVAPTASCEGDIPVADRPEPPPRGSRAWLHGTPHCKTAQKDGWIVPSTRVEVIPTLASALALRERMLAAVSEDDDAAFERQVAAWDALAILPMHGFAYATWDVQAARRYARYRPTVRGGALVYVKHGDGCVFEVAIEPSALVVPDEDWIGKLAAEDLFDFDTSTPITSRSPDTFDAWRAQLRARLGVANLARLSTAFDAAIEAMGEFGVEVYAPLGRTAIRMLLRSARGRAWLVEGARTHATEIAHQGPIRIVRRVG